MEDSVALALAAWRSISDGLNQQLARERVEIAIRRVITQTLERIARNSIDPSDRHDLAQDKVPYLLERILAGAADPGKEDSYCERAAKNLAKDHHRKAKRLTTYVEKSHNRFAEEDRLQNVHDVDAEAVLEQRLSQLRICIGEAPKTYALLLRAHYQERRSIESLAHERLRELIRKGTVGDPPGEEDLRRARNSIDASLCRARGWLKTRFARGAS